MFCTKCGTEIHKGNRFCTKCGEKITEWQEEVMFSQEDDLNVSAKEVEDNKPDTTTEEEFQEDVSPVGSFIGVESHTEEKPIEMEAVKLFDGRTATTDVFIDQDATPSQDEGVLSLEDLEKELFAEIDASGYFRDTVPSKGNTRIYEKFYTKKIEDEGERFDSFPEETSHEGLNLDEEDIFLYSKEKYNEENDFIQRQTAVYSPIKEEKEEEPDFAELFGLGEYEKAKDNGQSDDETAQYIDEDQLSYESNQDTASEPEVAINECADEQQGEQSDMANDVNFIEEDPVQEEEPARHEELPQDEDLPQDEELIQDEQAEQDEDNRIIEAGFLSENFTDESQECEQTNHIDNQGKNIELQPFCDGEIQQEEGIEIFQGKDDINENMGRNEVTDDEAHENAGNEEGETETHLVKEHEKEETLETDNNAIDSPQSEQLPMAESEISDEDEGSKKKGNKDTLSIILLKTLMVVLIILIIFQAALIGLCYFAPNTKLGQKATNITESVVQWVGGIFSPASRNKDIGTDDGDEPLEQLASIVSDTAGKYTDIEEITFDKSLIYPDGKSTSYEGVDGSKRLSNASFYTDSTGRKVTYQEAIITSIEKHFNNWYTKNTNSNFTGIKKLDLGEIRVKKDNFYSLCRVTYIKTDGSLLEKCYTVASKAVGQNIEIDTIKEEII